MQQVGISETCGVLPVASEVLLHQQGFWNKEWVREQPAHQAHCTLIPGVTEAKGTGRINTKLHLLL